MNVDDLVVYEDEGYFSYGIITDPKIRIPSKTEYYSQERIYGVYYLDGKRIGQPVLSCIKTTTILNELDKQ